MRSIGLPIPGFLLHLAGFAFGVIPIGLLIYGGPRDVPQAPLSYILGLLLIVLGAATGYFGSRATYQKHGLRAWEGFGFLVILTLLAFMLWSSYSVDSYTLAYFPLRGNYAWMPNPRFVLFAFIAPFIASFWMLRRETRSPVLLLQPDKLLNGNWSGPLSKNFGILSALVLIIFLQNSFNIAGFELIQRYFGTKYILINGAMPSLEMMQKSVSAQQFIPFLSGAFGGWAMWILCGYRGFAALIAYKLFGTSIALVSISRDISGFTPGADSFYRMLLSVALINATATLGGHFLGGWFARSSLKKLNGGVDRLDQALL